MQMKYIELNRGRRVHIYCTFGAKKFLDVIICASNDILISETYAKNVRNRGWQASSVWSLSWSSFWISVVTQSLSWSISENFSPLQAAPRTTLTRQWKTWIKNLSEAGDKYLLENTDLTLDQTLETVTICSITSNATQYYVQSVAKATDESNRDMIWKKITTFIIWQIEGVCPEEGC